LCPAFNSFADLIAMLEADLQFDVVKVDIWTARIEARPAVQAALCREGIGPTEERGR
jgi:hypothetical protein